MNSEKNNRFYADFEARFRGSRTLILERLAVYLPLLEPLKEHVQTFSALDLGCGRGEWLELLEAQGASARGIDLDKAQLESCHSRGLKASCNNALDELRALEENSQTRSLIFDEVDSGVGGAVAAAVGERLSRLGASTQTLVITHSPQVAARANQHLRITKTNTATGVVSATHSLNNEERTEEIARMLAGENITAEARAAAVVLLGG